MFSKFIKLGVKKIIKKLNIQLTLISFLCYSRGLINIFKVNNKEMNKNTQYSFYLMLAKQQTKFFVIVSSLKKLHSKILLYTLFNTLRPKIERRF